MRDPGDIIIDFSELDLTWGAKKQFYYIFGYGIWYVKVNTKFTT